MTDPQRLLVSASPATRALLEHAGEDLTGYDVGAGEARLRESLALLSGAALGSSAAKSSAGKLLLAKLSVKIGLVIITGSSVLALWPSAPPARVKTSAPVAVRVEHAAPARVVAPLPVATPAPALVAPKRKRRAKVEPPAPPPTVEAVPEQRVAAPAIVRQEGVSLRELEGIARARSLLRRDPEAAIALLDAQRGAFPDAMFAEERDALTVLALARAGRRALAREQAAVFLRRHPNGPFSDGVRAAAAP